MPSFIVCTSVLDGDVVVHRHNDAEHNEQPDYIFSQDTGTARAIAMCCTPVCAARITTKGPDRNDNQVQNVIPARPPGTG